MDEVEQKKKFDEKDGPEYLSNWSSKTYYLCDGVSEKEFEYNSTRRNGLISQTILNYSFHEIIAWGIFNDENWMSDNYPDFDDIPPTGYY
jgi:hypothetical protein